MAENKYEKEIEELLAGLGELPPREARRKPLSRSFRSWQHRWQNFVLSLSKRRLRPDQLMLSGILLIFATYILRFGLPMVSRYTAILGILLFFAGFAMAITGGGYYNQGERRWRGRPIDYNEEGWKRLKDWLRRWIR